MKEEIITTMFPESDKLQVLSILRENSIPKGIMGNKVCNRVAMKTNNLEINIQKMEGFILP